MAAHGVDFGIIGLFDGQERFAGEGGADVGGFHQLDGAVHHKAADGCHDLGAVDQGQAFLGGQFHHRNAGLFHGFGARHSFALIPGLAFAQHYQHHVAQGSQVAAGAQGALLGDDRMNALIEHIDHGLDGAQADAGVALAQRIAPQQHHRPADLLAEGFTHGAAVADDQIALQLLGLVGGDEHIAEFAETSGQAVNHSAALQLLVHISPGLVDLGLGLLGQFHLFPMAGHLDHIFDGQMVAVDHKSHICSFLSLRRDEKNFVKRRSLANWYTKDHKGTGSLYKKQNTKSMTPERIGTFSPKSEKKTSNFPKDMVCF